MNTTTAHTILLHLVRGTSVSVLTALKDMIRYEPFSSATATDMSIHRYIATKEFLNVYNVDEHNAIASAIDQCDFLRDTLPDFLAHVLDTLKGNDFEVDYERLMTENIFIGIFQRNDYVDLLTDLASRESLNSTVRSWLYKHLCDQLYDFNILYVDFIRLLDIVSEYGVYDLSHIHTWIHHNLDGPFTQGQLSDLITSAGVYECNIHTLPQHVGIYTQDLLENCCTVWPTNSRHPEMKYLCESIVEFQMSPGWYTIEHPIWSIIAGHSAVYHHLIKCYSDQLVSEKRDCIIEERRLWRLARLRVVVRGLWAGATLWRLYQTWALHPSRLRVASSGLSATTAPTRAALQAKPTEAQAPVAFPTTFRLLDVADYFDKQ